MCLQLCYNGTIWVMVQEVCGWAKVNVTSAFNSWESRFGLWACDYRNLTIGTRVGKWMYLLGVPIGRRFQGVGLTVVMAVRMIRSKLYISRS